MTTFKGSTYNLNPMSFTKTTKLLLVLFVITVTMACKNTKKTTETTKTADLTGDYTVVSLFENEMTAASKKPSFTFLPEENSFRGNTGCNSVFGNYEHSGTSVDFSQLAVSERYCSEGNIMEIEREFLKALNQTEVLEQEDNFLIFYTKNKEEITLRAQKTKK